MSAKHYTLEGKVALITGSGRGIGKGIAVELGSRGASIVLNYANTPPEAAIKEIEAAGSKAALVQANVAHLSELNKLVEAALSISEAGKIDILIHSAATGDDCYMEDMTEEFYQSQTDVNLKGLSWFRLSWQTADP